MVDTGIFATTAEVQAKVGANASTTYNAEAYINQYMTEAESVINAMTGVNWSDLYSGLNADVKGILKDAASCYAAIKVINADLSNFPTTAQAQTRIDVLDSHFKYLMKILADPKHSTVRDFIKGA